MQAQLQNIYKLDEPTINLVNNISHVERAGENVSVLKAVLLLVGDDLTRRSRAGVVRKQLVRKNIPSEHIIEIMKIARQKSLLLRRIAFLDTARSIFHYWHVVHFPFSVIMFLILAVHVIVTVSLGYTWIF